MKTMVDLCYELLQDVVGQAQDLPSCCGAPEDGAPSLQTMRVHAPAAPMPLIDSAMRPTHRSRAPGCRPGMALIRGLICMRAGRRE